MNDEILSAMAQILRAQNIDVTALAAFMAATDGGEPTGMTLGEFVALFGASLKNRGTKRSFEIHFQRLVKCTKRQCECTCTACVESCFRAGQDPWYRSGTS